MIQLPRRTVGRLESLTAVEMREIMDQTAPIEYDEWLAGLAFERLTEMFIRRGCTRVLVKRLAPHQDNDKNQIYVGKDLTQLGEIPIGDVEASATSSRKPGALGKTKFTAPVEFNWISPGGDSPAPHAKLIFYPQYAGGQGEVRLSGLVNGSSNPPKNLYIKAMAAQQEGRRLLLGIGSTRTVWGLILPPSSIAGDKIDAATAHADQIATFRAWRLSAPNAPSSREIVLNRLAEISVGGWHSGQLLNANGLRDYKAKNGGGYTLEALLGVSANGRAEPDFEGWEVKARKVLDPDHPGVNGVITLMTPEPVYRISYNDFMHRYGYSRPDNPNRLDFTGRHFANGPSLPKTGTRLVVSGWHGGNDIEPTARISIIDRDDEEAASWDIAQMVTHWTRKHAKCVYVPYTHRPAGDTTEYHYGGLVRMCQDTTLARLLGGFVAQVIYYDPGMNLKITPEGREDGHRRSQFRAKFRSIDTLYERSADVDALHPSLE